VPVVAIAAKLLEDPLTHSLPIAGAIAAVLAGVSEHLTGDATHHAIDSLKVEGNHDLEFILANSIRAALSEAHRELSGGPQLLAEPYDQWFSLWRARLDRGLKDPDRAPRRAGPRFENRRRKIGRRRVEKD
jgi:hypothetical protein